MKTEETKYNCQSIRLAGHDYSKPGYYFVTVCTHGRQPLFGYIIGDKMETNIAGQMIDWEWKQISNKYPWIHLYEHIVMPNHLHGIIQIMDKQPVSSDTAEIVGTPLVGVRARTHPDVHSKDKKRSPHNPQRDIDVIQPRMGTRPIPTPTLSDIIGRFKSIITNHYIQQVKQKSLPAFKKHMWQQRFYDRIIRHGNELNRMRNYITENPENWAVDRNNPAFITRSANGR